MIVPRDKGRWGVNIFTGFPTATTVGCFFFFPPPQCCSLLEACINYSLVHMSANALHIKIKTTESHSFRFFIWDFTIFLIFFPTVSQNVCWRLQASPLPRLHHRPLHGVPASCRSEALPQHAAVHLRDTVEEGKDGRTSCLNRSCMMTLFCQLFAIKLYSLVLVLCGLKHSF